MDNEWNSFSDIERKALCSTYGYFLVKPDTDAAGKVTCAREYERRGHLDLSEVVSLAKVIKDNPTVRDYYELHGGKMFLDEARESSQGRAE